MKQNKYLKGLWGGIVIVALVCWLLYIPYAVLYQLLELKEGTTIFLGFLWIIFWVVFIALLVED